MQDKHPIVPSDFDRIIPQDPLHLIIPQEPLALRTFQFVVSFLVCVLQHKEQNGASIEQLAKFFAPVLFRNQNGEELKDVFEVAHQLLLEKIIRQCLASVDSKSQAEAEAMSSKYKGGTPPPIPYLAPPPALMSEIMAKVQARHI